MDQTLESTVYPVDAKEKDISLATMHHAYRDCRGDDTGTSSKSVRKQFEETKSLQAVEIATFGLKERTYFQGIYEFFFELFIKFFFKFQHSSRSESLLALPSPPNLKVQLEN